MGLFQPAVLNSLGPGIYAVPVTPPPTLPAVGTQTACIVEQFPWGPSGTGPYDPSDPADLVFTFFPPGSNWDAAGPAAVLGKGWPDLRLLRVVAATGTAAATRGISSATPTLLVTATAKYVGTLGNSIVVLVAAAGNGVSTSFKATFTLTGTSGTTQEVCDNIDTTSANNLAASVKNFLAASRLIGGFTWAASGAASAGSSSFSGGLDGSVAATDYVGTLGTGDKGLALTEGEDDIDLIFFGNPGSFTATANAGMQAHVIDRGDRIGFISGVQGQTSAQAITDVASFRADQLAYVDPWMKQISAQTGLLITIPAAPLAASICSQIVPSTHAAWRDPEITTDMMANVRDVEAVRGNQAKAERDAGIMTLCRKKGGGFLFYADVTTNSPVNTAQPDIATIRMNQYIAKSSVDGFQSNVYGPNVPATQTPMRASLQSFLDELLYNRDHDPQHHPYLKAASLGASEAANPQSSLDAGNFVIPVNGKTDSGMIRVFILENVSPTAAT
ncbi:MAG TPA: hypothetical protein VGI39_39740 [Polyangiaceae bacterium]|jgi:hypothetical protein